MILTRIPIPDLPEQLSEAAYRWPMWAAGSLAVVFTVVFTVLLVMSILGKGNPTSDAGRGAMILALGAGMILSGLSAAGLDNWTQDRYRDANSQYWQQIEQIAANLGEDIQETTGMTIESSAIRRLLTSDVRIPTEGIDADGVAHDCVLYPSHNPPYTLTVECDAG